MSRYLPYAGKALIKAQHAIGTDPTPKQPGTLSSMREPGCDVRTWSYGACMHASECCAVHLCWKLGTCMIFDAIGMRVAWLDCM